MALEEIEEGKAYAEWLVVKREVLMSLYNAITSLRTIHRSKVLNKRNTAEEASFEGWTIDLYTKIRSKLDKPKYKKFSDLKKLDNYINDGTKLGFKNSLKYFFLLEDFVEKLGITDIEVKGIDIKHIFKRS